MIERHCYHCECVDRKGCLPAGWGLCFVSTQLLEITTFSCLLYESWDLYLQVFWPHFSQNEMVTKDLLFKTNLSCFDWSKLGGVNETGSAEERNEVTKKEMGRNLAFHVAVCRPHNLSALLVNTYQLKVGHEGLDTSLVHQIWKIGSSEMIRGFQQPLWISVDGLWLPIVLRLRPSVIAKVKLFL